MDSLRGRLYVLVIVTLLLALAFNLPTAMSLLRSEPASSANALPQPAECPTDHRRADVRVTQLLTPNQTVRAGQTFTTTVFVRNIGSCPAANAEVTLPFDPQLSEVIDAVTSRTQTWVREVTGSELVFASGPLDSGAVVTVTVRLRTLPELPPDTLLQQRLGFTADHNISGPNGRSNLAQLRIGPVDQQVAALALGVDPPQARAGTTFEFGSSLFAPAEAVTFWINDPNNQDMPVTTTLSLDDGSLTIAYDSSPLAPGSYRMVAFGNLSGLTASVPFTVLPAGTATPTVPPTATFTPQPSPSATDVLLTSATPTLTSTAFFTFTTSETPTATPTDTATVSTATSTATATATPTFTPTPQP